jgi:alkaline phosphatase D
MMRKFMSMLVLLSACSTTAAEPPALVQRIAFGSCLQQDKPQPIWDAILASRPDVFIFLGDNIYGDSEDMDVLAAKWTLFTNQPGYQRLRRVAYVTGTWDDHDFGQNDAGKEYPQKEGSKRLLLDALGDPTDSARRKRDGVYDAMIFGPEGRRVQIILLDTRWFRDPLERAADRVANRGPYRPTDDPSTTLLGEAQWLWLESQLRQPADLRIVASSIQFVPAEHGWEKWANFPHERTRMIELIARTGAGGVVFISGDRHHAEISRLTGGTPYPLYDLTSSSLNKPGSGQNDEEPNQWRLGRVYSGENFGLIEIDWTALPAPAIRMSILNRDGEIMIREETGLDRLRPD